MSALTVSSQDSLTGANGSRQKSMESYNQLLRASTGSRVILSRAQRLKMKEHLELLRLKGEKETKEGTKVRGQPPPPPSPLVRPAHYPPLYRPHTSPYRTPTRRMMAQAPTPSRRALVAPSNKRTRTGLSPALRAMEVSSPNVRQTRARYGKAPSFSFNLGETSPVKVPSTTQNKAMPPLSLGDSSKPARRGSVSSVGSLNSPRFIDGSSLGELRDDQESYSPKAIIDCPEEYPYADEEEEPFDDSITPLAMVEVQEEADENSVAAQAIQSIIDDTNDKEGADDDKEEEDDEQNDNKSLRWSFRESSFSFDGHDPLSADSQRRENSEQLEGKEPVPFLFRRTSVESIKFDDEDESEEEEDDENSFSVSPVVHASPLYRMTTKPELGEFSLEN